MDHVDNKFIAQLYRVTCPTSSELGEYHLKMLPDEQTRQISQHLSTCPHCAQELTQLENYLTELAPDLEHSLHERVQILLARLLSGGQTGSTPPVPALALRGDTDEPLMYEAGDYQLNLEIQPDPAKPGYKAILGLVVGVAEVDFQAQLWQDGLRVQVVVLDDLGNFVFNGVQPGDYDLILSRLTTEIHVQSFTV